jgi:hypothetical protein
MKKLILSSILIGIIVIVKAQTISEIRNSSLAIAGRMSIFYEHDISQYKLLRSVLKLDVFEYYSLQEQYDTDLKKKVYKASEEYKSKLVELGNKRVELKNTSYCLDFEPAYYERTDLIKYDLNTKSFTVTNDIYLDDFFNKQSYIQFDKIVFKCPIGLTVSRRQFEAGGVYFIKQSIKFKIDDESIALKIEENRNNLRLLFVFKFVDATPFEGLDLFGNKSIVYALSNILEKVIIYNSTTNDIYFTYK